MSEDRFHFEIPKENIRVEKYEQTGGGESFQRLNHAEHGRKLIEQTNKLKKVEQNKKDSRISENIYFQIETPKELSVKQERQKIENLGFEIINFSKENKSIGTAKINKTILENFEQKLNDYTDSEDHVGKTYFSVIEDISIVPTESKIKPAIDFNSEEKISIVINLYNVLARKERYAIKESIIEEIKKYTSEVNERTFSNDVTSIACVLKAKEIPLIVDEFSTIKEVKHNYTTFVENSFPIQAMPNPLTIENVESNSIICIVDSGIKTGNGVFDSIVSDQLLNLPQGSTDCHYDHGTFVSSRCVFGDNIESCLGTHLLKPYCKLLDVPVFGIDIDGKQLNPTEYHLRSVIEDIVINFHQNIKVYNLSFGSEIPIKDFEVSDLAKLLDYLSKTYKVLFVVSAGNINGQLGSFPVDHFLNLASRICLPAESILSLTIGSIAKHSDRNALAETNEVSPFSRIGPGSDQGIKPELVAHGGNLTDPYNYSPRVSTYGISSDGKTLCANIGTSFSAPLISQYAQKLFDLYPSSDPNLIKSLLCHFTEPRSVYDEITSNLINYTGFGEPIIEKSIHANEYNAAYIYEGQLDQENYQRISFHIPKTLASDQPETKLKIKITIVYDPPVNPDNEAEYSNARISATLFKPTNTGMKSINISADDRYQLPWNPTIQFQKTFSRSYLSGLWELRLRLYVRGDIDEKYLQDYAVVIEIIDDKESTDVYNDILSEYSEIYKEIKINVAA